ncbi:ABC transporter ATP-binding protein [Corynebacterium casei]|uniref:ABC transporter ATP-binding protein n=1 Tax=Corynebacterium casei TaxID=160386 RepID=UPI003FCFFAE0
MSNKTTVVARNVEKTYTLSSQGSEYSLFNSRKRMTVNALKGVSFVAGAGESIGVVGPNGSGKSTLFRLISGSESPSSGEIFVSSTPTLLGVSSALKGDLSGIENIRIGLLAMGLAPTEVKEIESDVADWANIGDAVFRPLKTYSSGMRSRLVFSVSTAVKREILLVDEALSTGDKTFTDKAKERMNSFLESTGTVFIVSHGSGTIQEYCNRAIWLHHGEIMFDGDAVETSKAYVRWSKMYTRKQFEKAENYLNSFRKAYSKPAIFFESEAAARLDAKPKLIPKRQGKHALG